MDSTPSRGGVKKLASLPVVLPYPCGEAFYENYENIVLFGSYNYSPFVSGCLEAIGITREEQEVARNFLTWYQQMLRIKGRDDSKPGSYTVIAPTTRFGSFLVNEGIMEDATTGRLRETLVPLAPKQPRGAPTKYTDEQRKAIKSESNKKNYAKRRGKDEQARNDP